ncbi:UNKNOWN [Stylonychia lemnae]|uniref:Uncharacterized protein n=1 Tax=Stylonychia lemnae TaxID=5949 RepID=A0A077ZUC7_STYLE|nr:UNKNOWN [Stylonychia lemnae]|eukprot:CDW73174.1 UNKNOWN [Stylonychia lemnae]
MDNAGIDGSLLVLQEENGVNDYKLLKWQIVAQKWCKVNGTKGINLSVYNEISVAIVDSRGLLSLSSQVGQQSEVAKINSNPGNQQNTPQPILNSSNTDWVRTSIPGHHYNKLTLLKSAQPGKFTPQEVLASFNTSSDIFVIYKASTSKVVGAYFQDLFALPISDWHPTENEKERHLQQYTAVLAVTERIILDHPQSSSPRDSWLYQFRQDLATGVNNDRGIFHFHPECIINSPTVNTKEYPQDYLWSGMQMFLLSQ